MPLVLLGERSRSRDQRIIVLVALLALSLGILEVRRPGTIALIISDSVKVVLSVWDYICAAANAFQEILTDIVKSVSA